MLAEKVQPQQELTGKRLAARDIAVGLDPHSADGLPASFTDPLLDGLKQFRVILPDVIVELRLALGEVEFGELFHETEYVMEGATSLATGLPEGPEPGHVDVCVAHGGDVHVQGRSGAGDTVLQECIGRRHAGVKTLAKGLQGVKHSESPI